jgi:iron complex transport system ATP-binding protein
MLKVQGLSYVPAGQTKVLLSDICFTHTHGFLGIIGPNGAGKSTLMQLISGFFTPTTGSVYWKEAPLSQMTGTERARQMALVSPREQRPEFALSVEAYIRLGRAPYQAWHGGWQAVDSQIQERVVAFTQIEPFLSQPLQDLSSGEWQRVQLSRSLMQEPELLLLDESTSHLDMGAQIRLLKQLKGFRQNELTLVVIHDLNLAAQYMDQLVLLHQGKIFCQGEPAAVLTPEHLSAVYGETWQVSQDPVTHKPVVLPCY